MTHIDDWIDNSICKDDGVKYAKFVLWYFRYPAWAQVAFQKWMGQYKLFCTYEGRRWRVTGASRLGDIWLSENLEIEVGHNKRVDVTTCSQWSAEPEYEANQSE